MSSIGGSGGSIRIGSGPTKSTDTPVATVQVGESKLSDVAQRLGVDADSLQTANPHISDPGKLKVGQEINLPQFQPSQPVKQADGPGLQDQGLKLDLPRAPMGDAVARNVMKARLSARDLAQVPGGAQDAKGQQMKLTEKDPRAGAAASGAAAKMDKYSESSKAGLDKASQKADDLAQVPGGAQDAKGLPAKLTEKDAGSGAAAKMDKYSESSKAGADKAFQKADDLAQVPGGAQPTGIQQMKFADKDTVARPMKMDKDYGASKAVDAGKAIRVDKSFQKADDLAQVPGGGRHADIQQMKFADKASIARDRKKMDKDYGDRKFYKPEGTAKFADAVQKTTLSKQKTASKASAGMDDYLKQ